MTLRSSDSQSESDLDSIRNSCDVLPGVHVGDNHGGSIVPQKWLQALSSVVKFMVTKSHCIKFQHCIHLEIKNNSRKFLRTFVIMRHLNFVYHNVPWKKSPLLIHRAASLPWVLSLFRKNFSVHLVVTPHFLNSGGNASNASEAETSILVPSCAGGGVFVGLLHPCVDVIHMQQAQLPGANHGHGQDKRA